MICDDCGEKFDRLLELNLHRDKHKTPMIHLTEKITAMNIINDELVFYPEIRHYYLPIWDESALK